jgi:hypothetical protein
MGQPLMAPAEAKHPNPSKTSTESQSSCITSPSIQAQNNKFRASSQGPVVGVKAGTPDAIALCRGALPGGNIWDYFQYTSTDVASEAESRIISDYKLINSDSKSACVASGRKRHSSVRRLAAACRALQVNDNEFSDGSLPSSPLSLEITPWKIAVVPAGNQELHLPPIAQKEFKADSGKLFPPGFDYYGMTPRSRRPSVDSTASTVVSESDNF